MQKLIKLVQYIKRQRNNNGAQYKAFNKLYPCIRIKKNYMLYSWKNLKWIKNCYFNCITAFKKELAVLYLSLNNNNSKNSLELQNVQKFKNITGSRNHFDC